MKYLSNALPVLVLTLVFGCNNSGTGSEKKESTTTSTKQKNRLLPAASAFDTTVDGKKIALFTIKNANGYTAAITNYGARMVGFLVPDKNGAFKDIVVGFDNIHDYITAKERFFGAIVGRFGNRIAKGRFSLDGKPYQLAINNAPNTLHGGPTGFHSRIWEAKQIDSQSVECTYVAADGEEGYPGRLTTRVVYKITSENELVINLEMSTDKKTIVNVTNHNYWNLNGEGSGTINNHELMITAANYTPIDSTFIPAGIAPVKNTPFDFTVLKKIGNQLQDENVQLKYGKGYDHNFVLDKGITKTPGLAAVVVGDKSGIMMSILTTEPGLQFYGGNFMQSVHTLKSGAKDDHRTALCLETQHFPDSPNQPAFPSTVLNPGAPLTSSTVIKFEIYKQ
jgi:aldose 1-epimerase